MPNKKCPSCGKEVPLYNDHCFNCGYDYPRDPTAEPKVKPLSAYPALESHLLNASANWTAAAVLRQYSNNQEGQDAFAKEVEVFGLHAYVPMSQSVDGGHVHVGRLFMTSGLSVFAGKRGIRSDGTISVTFQKASLSAMASTGVTVAPPTSSAGLETVALLEKLGQLRDAGVLSNEEFEAKKMELLARL